MSELEDNYSGEGKPKEIARRLRVALYIFLTAFVQVICWFFILELSIDNPQRIIFYYISYNIGFLIFPPYYGIMITGLLAWIAGIIFMFFMIYLIGETIGKLAMRRNKSARALSRTTRVPTTPTAT